MRYEQAFNNMLSQFSMPPQVVSICLIENGTKQVTAAEWDAVKPLFDWVDKRDIQQRILRLKGITLENERSIVAIYGDSKKIIEFERQALNFEPPAL